MSSRPNPLLSVCSNLLRALVHWRYLTMRTLNISTETWPLAGPFVITGYTMTEIKIIHVEIVEGDYSGRGEAAGVYYKNETVESMVAQAESVVVPLEQGADRQDLLTLLPSGGARNAIDAALWDLEAKQTGRSVWQMAGQEYSKTETVTTIGISPPEEMAARAAMIPSKKLKLKVSDDRPYECIAAVRGARSDADVMIDVNQGWTQGQLAELAPRIQTLDVTMIEQPLPRGGDDTLEDYNCPISLCADESCLDLHELDHCLGRYDVINIKLDKVGGLTAGLELARRCRDKGLGLMVGNMGGTSLAMAPAIVLAQFCDFVDVDGPLMLRSDREHALSYDNGVVSGLTPALWG